VDPNNPRNIIFFIEWREPYLSGGGESQSKISDIQKIPVSIIVCKAKGRRTDDKVASVSNHKRQDTPVPCWQNFKTCSRRRLRLPRIVSLRTPYPNDSYVIQSAKFGPRRSPARNEGNLYQVSEASPVNEANLKKREMGDNNQIIFERIQAFNSNVRVPKSTRLTFFRIN